ncbi:hypothetical protein AB0269_14445 [Microbacterium sp. NPDC077644]|uniref:phosphoribosyltransferase-like protein n=1 Tax=Microbacterium sp. NPDC077644 TaxID=3155055 RepID=UPI00344FDB01
MRLSQTPRAANWLRQFEVDDRDAAVALLDSILYVPGGEVIAGVRRSVEQLATNAPGRSPMVLAPMLSKEDMRDPNGEKLPADSEPTVFVEFDPDQPLDNMPGSEALFAHLIREMSRGLPEELIAPRPLNLESMRGARVRSLVLITDVIGSGQQALNYIDAWWRHGSLRSWHSYGLMKIMVVAYAATRLGLERVRAHRGVDAVHVQEIVPGLDQALSLNGRVQEICKRYARRGRLNGALGFRNSAGLFASSFSVPNNLPAILISRSTRWQPFFDGRSVSADLAAQLEVQRPVVEASRLLAQAGQLRLARRFQDQNRWGQHLAVLALLPATQHDLALKLGLSLGEVEQTMNSLSSLGLTDDAGQITSAGKQTLERRKKTPRHVSAGLRPDTSPYYPRLKR